MTTEKRFEKEFEGVLAQMKLVYPAAADWNALDDGTFEILDENDTRLGIIQSTQLDSYYNNLEV